MQIYQCIFVNLEVLIVKYGYNRNELNRIKPNDCNMHWNIALMIIYHLWILRKLTYSISTCQQAKSVNL